MRPVAFKATERQNEGRKGIFLRKHLGSGVEKNSAVSLSIMIASATGFLGWSY